MEANSLHFLFYLRIKFPYKKYFQYLCITHLTNKKNSYRISKIYNKTNGNIKRKMLFNNRKCQE